MTSSQSTADVSVVGLGRVGLPLALSLADRGLEVLGIDSDPARLEAVREGRMPFAETGAQELLDRVRAGGRMSLCERVADGARARHIVITLGTPSFSHIEIDMRDIRSALDDLLGVLAPGHCLILRYTNFALPNLLMMDCERHGANVFEVIDLINRDYPRGGIAQPGLTAGTCLRKDFTFSEERSPAPGMLLAVSRVNETVPLFLVEGIKRRLGELAHRKVAVLGVAFKADTDDERDSLAHKLIRLLERELTDVAVHDPHVTTPTMSFEEAVDAADAVVVATNHSEVCTSRSLAAIAERAGASCLIAH